MLSRRGMLLFDAFDELLIRDPPLLELDGWRRGGGGGIGLLSTTGLDGSVVGGVEAGIEGEGCAGRGLWARREGGGGGTALGLEIGFAGCGVGW